MGLDLNYCFVGSEKLGFDISATRQGRGRGKGRLPGRRFKESGVDERREKGKQGDACAVNTSHFLAPPNHFSAAGNCRERSTYPSPAE